MRVIIYILLLIGVIGVIHGIINFFRIGVDSSEEDNYVQVLFGLTYRENVRRTADYLVLFGGALLLFWFF